MSFEDSRFFSIFEQHSRDQVMQLVIVLCNSFMHDYVTVMRMSSAYPRMEGGGHGVGLVASQDDCKMGGAKLTFFPRGGGI